ncbi:MAG: energy transducer TonB [Bacteroidota bacterium]
MKNTNQLFLLLLSAIVFSCNNQKKETHETIIEKKSSPQTEKIIVADSLKTMGETVRPKVNISTQKGKTTLEIFYKQNEKKSQLYYTSNNKDTTIICAEKTKITIHENSFVSSKTGKEITGKVQISVKEYYKMSDILLAKLSTTSNGKLLESGGMINITASSNNEECKLKEGKTIEIEFPTKKEKEGMQVFSGIRKKDGEINWILDEDAIQYNQDFTNTVDIMPIYPGGIRKMQEFISNNIVVDENTKSGKVYATFVIDKQGNVTDAKIDRGLDKNIDKEVLRVVNKLKKFTPGKLKGIAVNTFQTIPISIKMNDEVLYESYYTPPPTKEEIKDKFENEFKDNKSLKNAGVNSINSYLLSSTQLGLINCDRFLNEGVKINYAVNFNNDSDTSVNLIFHSIKSFMSQSTISNGVLFKNIPIGEKITIVAIKYIRDIPYLAVQYSDTSSKLENGLVFQPVTLESLKTEMKKLDRFN